MAKRKDGRIRLSPAQKQRLGQDIQSLGLTPDKADVAVRFDVSDPEVKRRIDMLSRYGLVSARQIPGEHTWRVALTPDGLALAVTHYAGLKTSERLLTDAELEDKKGDEAESMAQTMAAGIGSKGGLVRVDLPPDPVFITTQTLRSFQYHATEKGMSRLLTQEVLDSLDPNAHHRVRDANIHTSDDGRYKNIRLMMDLFLKSKNLMLAKVEGDEIHQVIVDITMKDWDMLMVPHQHRQRREGAMRDHSNDKAIYLSPPKWAATRSYEVTHQLHGFFHGHVSAYERTGWTGPFKVPNRYGRWGNGVDDYEGTMSGDHALQFIIHPRALMNAEALEYLDKAHPVIIDPEWVEIQEEWTANESWAYAQRVVLPYDPLYLDFEGEGGRMPRIEVLGRSVSLAGCLIYTDHKSGQIVVQPIGGRDMLDLTLNTNAPAGGYPYEQVGRVVIGGRCTYGEPISVHGGTVGPDPVPVEGMYRVPHGFDSVTTWGVATDLPTFADQLEQDGEGDIPFGVDAHTVPGHLELPLRPDEAVQAAPGDIAWLMMWNATLGKLASKSLSMLSLIDNEHVILRESALDRPRRREVERDRKKGRDHGVASEIVVIRRERYVGNKKVDEDPTTEYSHQWRVRRHEQHHGPHTRTYQAKPWLAKPCGRCGSCRRFIIDSYIKGPADKPLKDKKTYIYKEAS